MTGQANPTVRTDFVTETLSQCPQGVTVSVKIYHILIPLVPMCSKHQKPTVLIQRARENPPQQIERESKEAASLVIQAKSGEGGSRGQTP